MEARARFSGAGIPTGVVFMFIVALLAAFLLGGAGGYVVRGLGSSATTTNPTSHPFVVEPVPYTSPAVSPVPQPTLDPKGFAVPI